MKEHILITGTGRAGTTFLVELLTNLGLETGFDSSTIATKKNKIARAGLEHTFKNSNCPYVVKDPNFFEYADEVFNVQLNAYWIGWFQFVFRCEI